MLQELGKQNPQIMQLIQENQAEFLRLINEPAEGAEGYGFSIYWLMLLYIQWSLCLCSVFDALDILNQEFARSVCWCWNASNNSCDTRREWSYTAGKALGSLIHSITLECICALLVIGLWLLCTCNIVVFTICAAWTNGLWPRSGSRGFLCLQQGWTDGCQLSVGPYEWLWRSSAIGCQMAWSTWLMMRLNSECSISVLKADYPNLGSG